MASHVRRLALSCAGAWCAVVVSFAGPLAAHADVVSGYSDGQAGSFTDLLDQDDHSLNVYGQFGGVAVGNTLIESFACLAVSSPDASFTDLPSCALNGVPAVSVAQYPGNVALAAGTGIFSLATMPSSGLLLCTDATAAFAETIVGSGWLAVDTCSPTAPTLPDVNATGWYAREMLACPVTWARDDLQEVSTAATTGGIGSPVAVSAVTIELIPPCDEPNPTA